MRPGIHVNDIYHVGRNYVPLFDVYTDLRYYVIRDVIDI